MKYGHRDVWYDDAICIRITDPDIVEELVEGLRELIPGARAKVDQWRLADGLGVTHVKLDRLDNKASQGVLVADREAWLAGLGTL